MAPASQAFQLAWTTGRWTYQRTGWQLPGGSRPHHPAPGGSPRWRGNVKSVAPRRKRGGHRGRTSLSVVAVLVFFVALAGLVVRGYVTGRQGRQYMLVNRVLTACPARYAD